MPRSTSTVVSVPHTQHWVTSFDAVLVELNEVLVS